MPDEIDLRGYTVGITADRRGEDQAVMFRRLGAQVVIGAMVNTVSIPDADELRACTRELISEAPDYLIANTGFGIRTWMAQAGDWGMESELKAALSRARIAARGPKAAGAVGIAGLEVWWRAPGEQMNDVVEHLLASGVDGKRVAFQLQGDSGEAFTSRLEQAGAEVIPVSVYQWTTPHRSSAAVELIEMCCEGHVDAVTFTAGQQVHNMVAIAEGVGLSGRLLDSLNGPTLVGCIGPVCAAAAHEEGIREPVVPVNWRLGALVRKLSEALVAARRS
jgi:uroporphyrinogen-III synthase